MNDLSILITNCFHWIGFHFTNYFLEQGYEVEGFHSSLSQKEEYLSMFIGRNSSFHMNSDVEEKQYDIAIHQGASNILNKAKAKQSFVINPSVDFDSLDQAVVAVYAPLLFGEWMPMTEKGMYDNNKFISFQSKLFLQQAIYIDDFIKAFSQWMDSSQLPSNIYVYSNKESKEQEMRLENSIFIRDNGPIEKKLESLISHFKKFKLYYSLE